MEQQETNAAVAVDISSHQLARSTFLNLIGQLGPLVVAIFATPFVIHHLGPDRYGLYSLALIVVGYFALFNLGIGPATTKYVAELLGKGEIDKLPELVWTAVASQTCLGLLGGILLGAASPFLVEHVLKIPTDLQPEARLIFLIMAVALPIDFASGSFSGVLGASQRFDLLNAVSVPTGILTYLGPVIALWLGFGLPAIVFSLVLIRAASCSILLALAIRLHPALGHIRFDFGLIRSLLGFGGWVTAAGALGPLLLYVDRFVIGAVVSIAAVGYYSVAFTTLYRLQFIPAALTASLMPAFSTLQGAGDISKTTALFVRAHKYVFAIVAPVIFAAIIFAKEIFGLWIGTSFARQVDLPFQILAIGMLVGLMAPISGALTQGRGRPDLLFWIYLAEIPANTIFTLFLAFHWNIEGAALSFSIRTIVETGVLFLITVRTFGMRLQNLKTAISPGTIGLVFFSAVVLPLLWVSAACPLGEKILLFSCAMMVYAFVFYRCALDPMERILLWRLIGRSGLSPQSVDA